MSTNAERQAGYRRRRAAEGLVQVQVYVPAAKREEIRRVARRLQRPTRPSTVPISSK